MWHIGHRSFLEHGPQIWSTQKFCRGTRYGLQCCHTTVVSCTLLPKYFVWSKGLVHSFYLCYMFTCCFTLLSFICCVVVWHSKRIMMRLLLSLIGGTSAAVVVCQAGAAARRFGSDASAVRSGAATGIHRTSVSRCLIQPW